MIMDMRLLQAFLAVFEERSITAAAQRILGQIDHYRVRRAPHFEAVRDLVRAALLRKP